MSVNSAESREQRGARAFDDVKRNGFMDRSAKKEGASEGRRGDVMCHAHRHFEYMSKQDTIVSCENFIFHRHVGHETRDKKQVPQLYLSIFTGLCTQELNADFGTSPTPKHTP